MKCLLFGYMGISLLQVSHKLLYYIHWNLKKKECVVNIINLPPVLPGELDLEDINQLLHADEATLNWSQVEDAPQEQLAVLLSGLDLVEHSEILCIETVPDNLSDVVLQALSRSESKASRSHEHKRTTNKSVSPVIWEPEEKIKPDSAMPSLEEAQLQPVAQLLAEPLRPMLQPPSPAALRDELEQLVLQYLLGPAG